MTVNAFAISRRLAEKGVDKATAEAVAEEIVTHSDERHATKEDIAEVKGMIQRVEAKMDAKFNLSIGLMSAFFIAFVVEKLIT